MEHEEIRLRPSLEERAARGREADHSLGEGRAAEDPGISDHPLELETFERREGIAMLVIGLRGQGLHVVHVDAPHARLDLDARHAAEVHLTSELDIRAAHVARDDHGFLHAIDFWDDALENGDGLASHLWRRR